MFENCDDCKRETKTKLEETIERLNKGKARDDTNINTSVHCSPDPVEIPNARVNDIPPYTFKDKNLFDRLKKEFEKSSIEVTKEEELMCYIVVLESLVDALTPGYFPTRDFIKMRKMLCPDWVDQLDQIDKKTDPALNYCV